MPTYMYEGEDRYGCPLRSIDLGARELLSLYPDFQQGILYAQGGLRDQPYKYVRAMRVIGAELLKIQREVSEANEAQSRRARSR